MRQANSISSGVRRVPATSRTRWPPSREQSKARAGLQAVHGFPGVIWKGWCRGSGIATPAELHPPRKRAAIRLPISSQPTRLARATHARSGGRHRGFDLRQSVCDLPADPASTSASPWNACQVRRLRRRRHRHLRGRRRPRPNHPHLRADRLFPVNHTAVTTSDPLDQLASRSPPGTSRGPAPPLLLSMRPSY